jgi:hypothetical protein
MDYIRRTAAGTRAGRLGQARSAPPAPDGADRRRRIESLDDDVFGLDWIPWVMRLLSFIC